MMLLKPTPSHLGHLAAYRVITVQRISIFSIMTSCQFVYRPRSFPWASGDLLSLSPIFSSSDKCIDVYYKGKKCEAINVLDEFGWGSLVVGKEGLALLNGTQFMSANGMLLCSKPFASAADLIAALSLQTLAAVSTRLWTCIQQIRPHQGQIETGEAFPNYLAGSELIQTRHKEHVQDPIPSFHPTSTWRHQRCHPATLPPVLLTEIEFRLQTTPPSSPMKTGSSPAETFHGQPLCHLLYSSPSPCGRIGKYLRTPCLPTDYGTPWTT